MHHLRERASWERLSISAAKERDLQPFSGASDAFCSLDSTGGSSSGLDTAGPFSSPLLTGSEPPVAMEELGDAEAGVAADGVSLHPETVRIAAANNDITCGTEVLQ